MQCSAVLKLSCCAVAVLLLLCGVAAQRGPGLSPAQDQVAKALFDLDRIYSKRIQSGDLSDAGVKSGEDLTKLKQAYKLLALQDLDNRYKMINRPRYGKRADGHFLDLVPADEVAPMERAENLMYADRR